MTRYRLFVKDPHISEISFHLDLGIALVCKEGLCVLYLHKSLLLLDYQLQLAMLLMQTIPLTMEHQTKDPLAFGMPSCRKHLQISLAIANQ